MDKPSLQQVDQVHLILDLIAGYKQISLILLHKERNFLSAQQATEEILIVCEEIIDRVKCHNKDMKV